MLMAPNPHPAPFAKCLGVLVPVLVSPTFPKFT